MSKNKLLGDLLALARQIEEEADDAPGLLPPEIAGKARDALVLARSLDWQAENHPPSGPKPGGGFGNESESRSRLREIELSRRIGVFWDIE